MTKKHAIPGLRLGYIVANENTIKALTKLKQPWTVNALAIEAGKYILDHLNEHFDLDSMLQNSVALQKALQRIKGIDVTPSPTPFFLVKLSKLAEKTQQFLIEHYGLLVRNASNFKQLDGHYIRINSRNKNDNNRLVNALKEWMQQS